jgi:EAL domain-containing protein (putative c-di-GMP-specific phosphodiesterase class I)
LAFQPVVAVAGGDEAQFQVLVRMHGADGSVRKAGDFLAAAQAAGLLAQLDRWVMERALALLQQRRAESRPVRLFVSQTPRTLGQDGFAGWLQQALERAGVDGPSLVIDIRQEDAVVHTVLLQQFCEQLVPVGVQFCLSQFRSTEDGNQLLQMLPLGYLRLSSEFAQQPLPQAMQDEMRVHIGWACK